MNRYIAEFVGTLLLMYVILATGNWLAIGGILAVIALILGPISGGAFNPAVAIVYSAVGKIPSSDVVPYIIAELAGALAAFELIKLMSKK